MGLHRLFHFLDAEARVSDAVGHPVAFLGDVLNTQFHGIHAQFGGQLIDHRLNGEGALRLAGSAVSLHLLLVHHHVVAVNQQVLDVVRPGGAESAAAHRRAGESARLERHPALDRSELAVLGGPYLGSQRGGRSRAGALENVLAAHHQLDRAARNLRQDGRQRLQVGGNLCAEAAPDFRRDDAHQVLRHAADGRRGAAYGESALGAGPDGQPPVAGPGGGGGVGLDVTLVHRASVILALQDYVRLAEPPLHVAQLVLDVAGDVAPRAGVLAAGEAFLLEVGGQGLVNNRRVGPHGVFEGQHRLQHFVVDVDQGQRLLGDVRAGGGHGGDGVSLVQRLLVGHHVLGHQPHVALRFRQVDDLVLDDGKVL